MTVKYEYTSDCCGHKYMEQRAKDEAIFFPVCNVCGNGNYVLVAETVISEEVERLSVTTISDETKESTE